MMYEKESDIENAIVPSNLESSVQFVTTTLSSVPVVGGVISATANHYIQKRQSERHLNFFVNLAADLKEANDKMNREFMESEDFKDLVEDTFYKVTEDVRQKKLDAYRAIFLNTVFSKSPNIDESFEMLKLIYNWEERHIVLLKILADPIKADNEMGNVVGNGGGFTTSLSNILVKLLPNWTPDQINRTWHDLYTKRIHRTEGINVMITDQGIHQLENRLADYGKNVVKYIENPC